MNLSKKTFTYSVIISVIIVSLIVGYFILMLPSLYIDYMQNRNYRSVVSIQEGVMKYGSYDNLAVNNPTGTITVKIPSTGNYFYILNKFFKTTVKVQDQDFLDLLNKIRYYSNHTDKIKDINRKDFDLSSLKKKLIAEDEIFRNTPLIFTFDKNNYKSFYKTQSSKLHTVSDHLIVYESNVSDGHNYYTSYFSVGKLDDNIFITFVPMMTPRMNEIQPVIFQSMPMIIAIAILLVLISSQVFSRFIVRPIIRLANHAEFMKQSEGFQLEPLKMNGQDEISALGESLNQLYAKIQESYRDLEIANSCLAEENKRQEVFLRASSHQLKTPVAAALLLVEGMMNEVGKYKNVKEYLPQVKTQLQSMQRIIEEILYLNHCTDKLQLESHSLEQIVHDCLNTYQIQIEEKSLQLISKGHMPDIITDEELMGKLIDNLISNAVNYSPAGQKIEFIFEENLFIIHNYGVTIEEELLPHVFEAFVTSNNNIKGHGLGLYIVSYYAKLLNCEVKIGNTSQGVRAELIT